MLARLTVTVNGATTTRSYNEADQVIGWSYDGAGNLTSDGTTTTSYDALNRVTTRGATSYRYNGDDVLVAQTAGATITAYTQDVLAPLSQVLCDGTNRYVYGLERLGTLGSSPT